MSEIEQHVEWAEDPVAEHGERVDRAALSSRDRRILDFERDWQRSAEAKHEAVESEFGLSSARYYQVLNAIMDSPAALAYDPMLVRRLQRVRAARTTARTLQHPPAATSAGLN